MRRRRAGTSSTRGPRRRSAPPLRMITRAADRSAGASGRTQCPPRLASHWASRGSAFRLREGLVVRYSRGSNATVAIERDVEAHGVIGTHGAAQITSVVHPRPRLLLLGPAEQAKHVALRRTAQVAAGHESVCRRVTLVVERRVPPTGSGDF